MDEEIWKVIEGFEDYMVSTHGNVMSYKKKDKPIKLAPFLTGRKDQEYLTVGLRKNNKRTNMDIHRLVGLAFIENPNNLKFVDHIDSKQRFNNNVLNLRWADGNLQAQNKECVINAKNIYARKDGLFQVCVMRNGQKHQKSCETEAEAIEYKKEILAKYR